MTTMNRTIQAITVDAAAPTGFARAAIAAPVPVAHQIIMAVEALAVIERDFLYAPRMLPSGGVWGFNATGVVSEPAADGSGPGAGERVTAFLKHPGAWAQRIAVDSGDVARLPHGLDGGAAAALVVPGLTAIQALRRCGSITGRRVLITGASGAVGWFAIQLAVRNGAHVVAQVRNARHVDRLKEIGVTEIVTDLKDLRPVDGVLDTVGGAGLLQAFNLLVEGGSLQAIGSISAEPTILPPNSLLGRRRRIESFTIASPAGDDLQALLELAASGKLRLRCDTRTDWTEFAVLAAQFTRGAITGTAIVRVA